MRDLIVSLFILGAIPFCFRRPFIGLLMFTLLAYMRIQDLTWGFAKTARWSLYVAIVMFAGFLVMQGRKKLFISDVRCWIMVALVFLVGLSLATSKGVDWKVDFSRYIEYCKIILIALFTTGIVRHREHLRILMLTVALSFGFYGVKSGAAGVASGFGMKIIEGPGGMISDNNDFAMALCMALPLLYQLGMSEKRVILKRVLIGTVPLTATTIILTHSRGAFLSLAAVVLVLIWRSRNRVAGLAVGALLSMAFMLAVPSSYVERISTITEYDEDASAMGRIRAWKVAANMILANPILGVGFDKFQANYRTYDIVQKDAVAGGSGTKVAHNSYLQIWAECGTIAFLLYVTLIVFTFIDLWRIRKAARERYHASWILSYTTGFEASLVAFTVGSVFLNRAHFDLFYHFVAIVLMFGLIARKAMEDEAAHPYRATQGTLPAVSRQSGFRGSSGFAGNRGFDRSLAPGR